MAAVVWFAARPPAVFIIRIRNGKPQVRKGKVTDALLRFVAEICQEFGLQKGEIRGVVRGLRISLWFSSNIAPAARQRMRNWWALSGF
jgi:hypothetical protein